MLQAAVLRTVVCGQFGFPLFVSSGSLATEQGCRSRKTDASICGWNLAILRTRLLNASAPSASESSESSLLWFKDRGHSRPSETIAQSIALIAPTGAPVMTVPLVLRDGWPGLRDCVPDLHNYGVLLVALNVNQFARVSSSPGSLYTYITGPHACLRWGVLAGWALLIAYIGTASPLSVRVLPTMRPMSFCMTASHVQAYPLIADSRAGHICCLLSGVARCRRFPPA